MKRATGWFDSVPKKIWGLALAATFANLLSLGAAALSWWMVAFSLLYATYAAAAILLVVAFARHLRGMPCWPLPLLGRRVGIRASHLILLGFVVAFTLLREGAIPGMSASYGAYRSHQNTRSRSSASENSMVYDDLQASEMPSMRGQWVNCRASCGPSTGAACRAALEGLCQDDYHADEDAVSVSIHMEMDEPFCYVPLVKVNELRFSATVNMHQAGHSYRRNVIQKISGTIKQSAIGPMSCASYRREAGAQMRETVVSAVNSYLRNN